VIDRDSAEPNSETAFRIRYQLARGPSLPTQNARRQLALLSAVVLSYLSTALAFQPLLLQGTPMHASLCTQSSRASRIRSRDEQRSCLWHNGEIW